MRLVILGRVERNSYQKLVPEIERLFRQSIASADIVRDSENPPAPNRQESVGRERKKSNENDKDYVTKSIRRKKRDSVTWYTSYSAQ